MSTLYRIDESIARGDPHHATHHPSDAGAFGLEQEIRQTASVILGEDVAHLTGLPAVMAPYAHPRLRLTLLELLRRIGGAA